MQNVMQTETSPPMCDEIDEELVDVLIAISVVSKRLATKLQNQAEKDKE